MKCRTSKCNASCCYNVPFEDNELERFANMIVNPIISVEPLFDAKLPFTSEKVDDNKCPFLRHDFKCNIYENRPDVCRKFGVIDKLPCKYIKI